MHQPHRTAFQPAIYICGACATEHNGDVHALPAGWDRVAHPVTGHVTVHCPDCLETIERDWIAARAELGLGAALPTAMQAAGIVAATYAGGVA